MEISTNPSPELCTNPLPELFPGFAAYRLKRDDAELFWLSAGSGPPLLLLHGFPQTLAVWHRVAGLLRAGFRLVIPDLRGYGRSRGPQPDALHHGYSKRAMADDALAVMQAMDCTRFAVAGHDRGARVAYRLALDHPEAVEALALLDILSTFDMWEQMRMQAALRSYHWLFLAQPAPMPEKLIGSDPLHYLHHLLERWKGRDALLDPRAVADYEQGFLQPSTIEACCEDYRAGAGIDRERDLDDRRAGRRFACPLLLIWGSEYFAGSSPRAAWEAWAALPGALERPGGRPGRTELEELCLDCGHFIAEEQPEACAEALRGFFRAAIP